MLPQLLLFFSWGASSVWQTCCSPLLTTFSYHSGYLFEVKLRWRQLSFFSYSFLHSMLSRHNTISGSLRLKLKKQAISGHLLSGASVNGICKNSGASLFKYKPPTIKHFYYLNPYLFLAWIHRFSFSAHCRGLQ